MKSTRGNVRGKTCDPHAALWAGLTIVSFPFVALCAHIMGYNPAEGFIAGIIASILVILIEMVTIKRTWIGDPCISEWLGHPELGFRLLSLVAVIVLLFQTFILVSFLVDPSFDMGVAKYILRRQCGTEERSEWFKPLCSVTREDPAFAIDPASSAIRAEAARRFFPDAQLVTCATKTIQQKRDDFTIIRSTFIRCDQWMIGVLLRNPISVQSAEAVVMTKLLAQSDGSYEVQEWSDDPSSDEWGRIDASVASSTEFLIKTAEDLQNVQQALAAETTERAYQNFSREE